MRIHLCMLFFLCIACSQGKNNSLKELLSNKPSQMPENNFTEELYPYLLAIDSNNICWGDTFKVKFIGQKRAYDSISIKTTKGFICATQIDSIWIIAVPTQEILFLPKETKREEFIFVRADILPKGRKWIKSYPQRVYFNVFK